MVTTFPLGSHRTRQVEDVIELSFAGPLSLEETVLLHEQLARTYQETGRCYLLCDLSDVATIGAEARHYMSEWNRTHRLSGVVLHGGNFPTRVIATLTIKAIRLLGNHQTEIAFVRDEAEARRWITVRRGGAWQA